MGTTTKSNDKSRSSRKNNKCGMRFRYSKVPCICTLEHPKGTFHIYLDWSPRVLVVYGTSNASLRVVTETKVMNHAVVVAGGVLHSGGPLCPGPRVRQFSCTDAELADECHSLRATLSLLLFEKFTLSQPMPTTVRKISLGSTD